jgi:EmrB/QacA subfamily drug resistance transporter
MEAERVKRLTLVACVLGSGIALLDSTIVNVALPAIARDLGGGLAGQQWVVTGYLLVLGSLMLVGGSLGDVLGERRVFTIGVAGFGVTSLLCALAPSIELLVAARALQGAAGALLTPSALAVIVATFGRRERGAAIGAWTAWVGIATIIGPLAGGELVALGSWRWVFLVNVVPVTVCLALILAVVPASRGPRDRHVDVPGAALCALGLGGPVFALVEQPRLGWGSPGVVVPLVAGLAVLAVFLLYESRGAPDPMLPLRLFRRHNFWAGNVETLAIYAGLAVLLFLLALFLQQVAGYTALEAGAATLPVTVVMFTLSRLWARLADRRGPRLFMGVGPLVAAAGLLLLRRAGVGVSYVGDLLPALLLFGLGLSMTVAPLTAAVLAGADAEQAGIASAVNNATARIAGLLCVSAIGAVVGGHVSVSGFHTGIAVAAGLVALGGVLGLAAVRNPPRVVGGEDCAGGQVAGVTRDGAGGSEKRPVAA